MRFALVAMFVAASLGAAETEHGRAAIRNFRTRDLEARGAKAGPQNFSITQDARGLVYLANNLGVIELDNHSARLIVLPQRASALSLDHDAHDRIWVGAVGNLGYLAPDARGTLTFVSLKDRVPAAARDFGDVWQTSVVRDGIYFRSPTHLLRWNGKAMKVWTAPNGFHVGNVVDGRLIVRQNGIGLSTVDGDRLHLLPGGERFAEEKVYVILPWGDGRLLLVGRTSGVVLFDPAGRRPIEQRVTECDAFIRDKQAYHGALLGDGTFALASLRGGVAILDRDGRLRQRYDKKRGLNDDMVFFAYAGRSGQLWLGLNYGVSIVDDPTAVTKLPNEGELGLEGFVESIARFGGSLYASTSRGVYQMMPAASTEEEPHFTPVADLAVQSYTLLPAGGTLLAATRDGIVELHDGKKSVVDPDFAYRLAPAHDRADRIVAAYDLGVGILEHQTGWKVLARNREAGHEVVGIADAGGGELWAGTESEGLYRLRLDEHAQPPRLLLEGHFDIASGLPEGWVYPQVVDGRLAFLTREGIFRRETNRFVRDAAFTASLGTRPAFRVEPSADGRTLWIVSDNEILRLDRDGPVWKRVATGIRGLGAGGRILSFLPEGDVLWIGGDDGLFRYVPYDDRRPPPPRATIREVRLGDGTLLFGGAAAAHIAPIPHARNTVRFEAAGAADTDPEVRYRLDGFDGDWSAWTRDGRKEYTNLPGGDYTFRVAARDRHEQAGPETTLAFTVLPPWYATWWAIAAFVALALLFVVLLTRVRGAQLRKRNRELEEIVAAKTAALREASYTDPLTGLRNRRHFAEVVANDRDPMLLLLIDLDLFKSVNDRFGHATGDAILIETARRLGDVAKDGLLFRWGGEEFLLVVHERGAEGGEVLAARILSAIGSTPFPANGEVIPLTASVGWSRFPIAGSSFPISLEGAIDLADHALYEAKKNGRNQAVGPD